MTRSILLYFRSQLRYQYNKFLIIPILASDSSSGSSGSSDKNDDEEDDEEEDAAKKVDDDDAGTKTENAVEGEDTMKNLRKTFAGIFGDIN